VHVIWWGTKGSWFYTAAATSNRAGIMMLVAYALALLCKGCTLGVFTRLYYSSTGAAAVAAAPAAAAAG
jgi:hypothetical protein